MQELRLKFVGIDNWNRPVFRNEKKYYGSVDSLFNDEAEAERVIERLTIEDNNLHEEIVYFGTYFNCEPMGNPISETINIILEA